MEKESGILGEFLELVTDPKNAGNNTILDSFKGQVFGKEATLVYTRMGGESMAILDIGSICIRVQHHYIHGFRVWNNLDNVIHYFSNNSRESLVKHVQGMVNH